ncbi:Uncharacterised protein [Yersinia enterocolitica]|nr:Uncharacterised protein [Yersinia enterocolitica]
MKVQKAKPREGPPGLSRGSILLLGTHNTFILKLLEAPHQLLYKRNSTPEWLKVKHPTHIKMKVTK